MKGDRNGREKGEIGLQERGKERGIGEGTDEPEEREQWKQRG